MSIRQSFLPLAPDELDANARIVPRLLVYYFLIFKLATIIKEWVLASLNHLRYYLVCYGHCECLYVFDVYVGVGFFDFEGQVSRSLDARAHALDVYGIENVG